jgi:hypothetical protein
MFYKENNKGHKWKEIKKKPQLPLSSLVCEDTKKW